MDADAVAQKILAEQYTGITCPSDGWLDIFEKRIAAALESYAKEQVAEAIKMTYEGGRIWKDYFENVRQEAKLEELSRCAKIAEDCFCGGCCFEIARRIREAK